MGLFRADPKTGSRQGKQLLHSRTRETFQCVASADGKRLVLYLPTEAHAVFLDTAVEIDRPEAVLGASLGTQGDRRLVLSKDGRFLVVFHGSWMSIWNWGERGLVFMEKHLIPPGMPRIYAQPSWPEAAFSPDNKMLVIATAASCLAFDVPQTPKRPPLPQFGKGPAQSIAFSPDGKTLLTSSGNEVRDQTGSEQLWDVAAGKVIGQPLTYSRNAICGWHTAISPDGKLAVSLGHAKLADGRASGLRIREVATGKEITQVADSPLARATRAGINTLAFSADGKSLVVVGGLALPTGSGTYCSHWDLASGELMAAHPLKQPVNGILLGLSPRGRYYFLCDTNYPNPPGLVWWDAKTGKQAGKTIPLTLPLNTVAFNSDETLILTTTRNLDTGDGPGEARLWSAVTGRPVSEPAPCIRPCSQHGQATATAFAPDGKTFVIQGWWGAQFWDTATFRPIGPTVPTRGAYTVAFDPRGQQVAIGVENGVVLVPAPQSLQGDVERIRLWIELATWKTLDPGGALVDLDARSWQERYGRLQKLGGPPMP
jgi:WD40 repeat protein